MDSTIDLSKKGKLTIIEVSSTSSQPLSGLDLTLYRVGTFVDGHAAHFKLSEPFIGSGIDLNDISEAGKHSLAAARLEGYTQEEGLDGEVTLRTDSEGRVVFDSLELGLYLVRISSKENGDPLVASEPFLVSLPMKAEDGKTWNYHVVAKPKSSTPSEEVEPILVILNGKKTLDEKTPMDSAYTFLLKNSRGETIQIKRNKKGAIIFDPLTFTQEGTYKYTILEWENPKISSIVFDKSVYEVAIKITKTEKELSYVLDYLKDGQKHKGTFVFANERLTGSKPTSPPVKPPLPSSGERVLSAWIYIGLGIVFLMIGFALLFSDRKRQSSKIKK